MIQQITLRNIEKPAQKNPRVDVAWICDSFGFSTGRDIEDISTRTVFSILNRYREMRGTPSEILARDIGISPARVNYHVRTLMDAGLLYRERKLIHLRAGSMKSAVAEMRKDANRIFDELSEVAEEIDTAMGFRNRE